MLDFYHSEVFTYTEQGVRYTEGDSVSSSTLVTSHTPADGSTSWMRGTVGFWHTPRTDGGRQSSIKTSTSTFGLRRFAYANGRFYIAIDEPGGVDRVDVYSNGEQVEDAEFDLTVGSDPIDIAAGPNGLLYVLGGGAVFAYTTSGQPVSGAHFDLSADNGDPVGIAYANGRFYVADDDADKVFAYSTEGRRVESRRPDMQ